MRIALCQLVASPNKSDNLEAAVQALREAGRRGADVALLPEVYMAFVHPKGPAKPAEIAEPVDGPFVSSLAAEARAQHLYVGCGLWEAAPGERVRAFNTTVLIGPDGRVVLAYRKTHLYDAFAFRESDLIVAGDEPPDVIRTPLGTFGLLVCYELRFPELARRLALAGADVLLLPAAWIAGPLKEAHWATLLQARAIENTIFVAAANQTGNVSTGRSVLVDPMGVSIVDAGEEPGVYTGDVDLARIARVREKLPLLQQRRDALYTPPAVGARR
ncbi:MAG TPA: carbon-nitrogen hydrolase family protein [bacterium]|nr:carbon-nitrogen hydrolase family protein [bacterium]